jgi:hypothetical protein
MASDNGTPIANEALRSLQQFRAICSKLDSTEHLPSSINPSCGVTSESFADALGRFNVWIGNMGALSRGRSSLDHRLAHTDVQIEVLRLVRKLGSCLSECRCKLRVHAAHLYLLF